MRLSSANQFDASLANLNQRAVSMQDAQDKVSSLKRVSEASDDPTAAARAERALTTERRAASSQRSVDASRNSISLAESSLGDAGNLLQSARESLVQAGNGTYTDAERKTLAEQLRGIRSQLLSVANRDDGAGTYLFGGQGTGGPPFVDAPGGVAFVGADGTLQTATTDGQPLTTDGDTAWLRARTGNGTFETQATVSTGTAVIDSGRVTTPSALTGSTYAIKFNVNAGATTYDIYKDGVVTAATAQPYVSGQAITFDGQTVTITGQPAAGDTFTTVPSTPSLNVFSALDKAATALETTGVTGPQVAQAVAFGLRDIDASLGRLQQTRSDAGETLQHLDTATGRLDDVTLQAKTDRSNAVDLDLAAAVSDFQTQQTGYDAALKAYTMVQRLSLFQYINP